MKKRRIYPHFFQGKKRNKEITLGFPHAIELAFNSGWFEYKASNMLNHWKRTKNICMNCRFPFKTNVDKNEVDIIVNAGNKLLFVECKTQINKTTDIDKFNSVAKAYGGTAKTDATPSTDVLNNFDLGIHRTISPYPQETKRKTPFAGYDLWFNRFVKNSCKISA